MITDFIQNSINNIFKTFPNLNECIYSYDKYSNTYFIKIESIGVYESEEFAKLDAEISMNFYNLGVDGSLCIISPESQVDLSDPKSFFNKIILEESILSDGVLNFSLIDTFHNLIHDDKIVLMQDLLDESFNYDNSFTYSLAA